MLARYLRTHTSPVRYALPAQFPPDLSEAIRNYLLLSLRGANVPHLHHQSQGVLQPFYQEHPAAQGAIGSLLGQQPDPGDLLAYLDMLGEHGGTVGQIMTRHHDGTAGGQLLSTLSHPEQMAAHLFSIARPLTDDLLSPQSPVRAFGAGQLRNANDAAATAFRAGGGNSARELALWLHHALGQSNFLLRPLQAQLFDHITLASDPNRSGPGAATAMHNVYNTAHRVYTSASERDGIRQTAEEARDAVARAIHTGLIPHLYENQP